MSGEMIDGDALLEKINPVLPRRTAHVCLRPDLLTAWEEATDKLAEIQAATATTRLAGAKGGGAEAKKQARVVQKIEEQIREATTTFEFESLSTPAFQALTVKHPPREDDQFDFMAGYNREAVNDALVRMCLVNMSFTDEGWERLRANCPPSEWAELREKAMAANGERVRPPKSPLASQILGQLKDVSA